MDIQKIIKQRGFTIKSVADQMTNTRENKVGISQGSLSTILNGNPSIDRLQEIARIIGVPLSELVKDDNQINGYIEIGGEVKKVTSVEELEKIVRVLKKEDECLPLKGITTKTSRMKKFIIFLILLALPIQSYCQDYVKFMGVGLNNQLPTFTKVLKENGFSAISHRSDEYDDIYTFNGEYMNINNTIVDVVTNTDNGRVKTIDVKFPSLNDTTTIQKLFSYAYKEIAKNYSEDKIEIIPPPENEPYIFSLHGILVIFDKRILTYIDDINTNDDVKYRVILSYLATPLDFQELLKEKGD